jgi:hypothetical protein
MQLKRRRGCVKTNPRAFSEKYKRPVGLPKLRTIECVEMRVPASQRCEGATLSSKPEKV